MCHSRSSALTRTVTSVYDRALAVPYLDIKTFMFHKKLRTSSSAKGLLTFQRNQPTRCNSFISLLLDVYVYLNMIRAPLRPSSGAYNCTRSLWFYRWSVAVAALLVVVWQVTCQTTTNNAPTVKPEAPSAVLRSWWWAQRRPKHAEPHINVK
jgi:hypothetical protein